MDKLFSFSNTTFENIRRVASDFTPIVKEVKRDIIKSLALAKSGHSGGSIGVADIMVALFFGGYMRYNPKDPNWSGRDKFILSAGHLAPVLYSCLARAGYFPPEELSTLRKLGSRLQGHPASVGSLPGIETTAGSLGQGASIAVGMAMNEKLLDKTDNKVFCLTGDGELQEGSCWEAAMAASFYKLDNLCWFVDNNDCQIDGRVKDVMSIYPLREKFESFNFRVLEVDNANDIAQILVALDDFAQNAGKIGKPTCIIGKTKMGNGISFMEDDYKWHGTPPTVEQAIQALEELSK